MDCHEIPWDCYGLPWDCHGLYWDCHIFPLDFVTAMALPGYAHCVAPAMFQKFPLVPPPPAPHNSRPAFELPCILLFHSVFDAKHRACIALALGPSSNAPCMYFLLRENKGQEVSRQPDFGSELGRSRMPTAVTLCIK